MVDYVLQANRLANKTEYDLIGRIRKAVKEFGNLEEVESLVSRLIANIRQAQSLDFKDAGWNEAIEEVNTLLEKYKERFYSIK